MKCRIRNAVSLHDWKSESERVRAGCNAIISQAFLWSKLNACDLPGLIGQRGCNAWNEGRLLEVKLEGKSAKVNI